MATRITNPHATLDPGPLYVVLGPPEDEPGIYQPRPENIACGRFAEIFPIVVICKDIKEAFKVDALNSVIRGIPYSQLEDKEVVVAQFELSNQLHRCFLNCKKFNALRVAAETGIYCGLEWNDYIAKHCKYPKLEQQSFGSFFDALKYMVSKQHLIESPQSVSVSRGPSPVKRSGSPTIDVHPHAASRSSSPTKLHPSRDPSPTKGSRFRPDPISRAASVPLYAHAGSSASAAFHPPTSPSRVRVIPCSSRMQPSTTHGITYGSASAARPLSSYTHRGYDVVDETPQEPDDGVANQLDQLNLDSEPKTSTLTIDQLRGLIRPPTAYFPEHDPSMPAIYMGPAANLWLSTRALSPGAVLGILQVFLYTDSSTDFKMFLGRPPLRMEPADAEYLWMLLMEWYDPS